MPSLADNPFAALTTVVAPAILTNASSVLCLGTGNRIARVVDRTRVLTVELATLRPDSPLRAVYTRQLDRLKERSQLLLRALRFFYTSLGAFAAAALVSIFGAVLAGSVGPVTFQTIAGLALAAGSIGVGGLVFGCTLMVRETRLALRNLEEEASLAQDRASGHV